MSQTSGSLSAVQFIQQVLAARPAIAVFDCDGTLWSGDAGADFFYWQLAEGYVAPEIRSGGQAPLQRIPGRAGG